MINSSVLTFLDFCFCTDSCQSGIDLPNNFFFLWNTFRLEEVKTATHAKEKIHLDTRAVQERMITIFYQHASLHRNLLLCSIVSLMYNEYVVIILSIYMRLYVKGSHDTFSVANGTMHTAVNKYALFYWKFCFPQKKSSVKVYIRGFISCSCIITFNFEKPLLLFGRGVPEFKVRNHVTCLLFCYQRVSDAPL